MLLILYNIKIIIINLQNHIIISTLYNFNINYIRFLLTVLKYIIYKEKNVKSK